IATPDFGNSLLGNRRVGDEVVDALRRTRVPAADPIEHPCPNGTERRRNLANGTLALVPDVAKRTVAVVDVHRRGGGADAMGESTRARDDDRMVAQPQSFGRTWQRRKQHAKAMLVHAQPLEVGRTGDSAGEFAVRSGLVVKEGVDGCLRPAGSDL